MIKLLKAIKNSIFGLFIVGNHLIKRPITEEYPEEFQALSNTYRGVHSLKNCKGCGFCQKVCPTDAIIIQKDKNSFKYFINLKKCIFCGNCEYYCPIKAMKLTNEMEKPVLSNQNLNVEIINNED